MPSQNRSPQSNLSPPCPSRMLAVTVTVTISSVGTSSPLSLQQNGGRHGPLPTPGHNRPLKHPCSHFRSPWLSSDASLHPAGTCSIPHTHTKFLSSQQKETPHPESLKKTPFIRPRANCLGRKTSRPIPQPTSPRPGDDSHLPMHVTPSECSKNLTWQPHLGPWSVSSQVCWQPPFP